MWGCATRNICLQSCGRVPLLSGPRTYSSHSKQKYKSGTVLHNSSAVRAICLYFCVKERILLFVFLFRFSGQRLFDGLAGEHLVSHGCVVNKASDDYSNLLEIIGLQAIVDVHI